jgi:hypothetical protein
MDAGTSNVAVSGAAAMTFIRIMAALPTAQKTASLNRKHEMEILASASSAIPANKGSLRG